MADLGKAKSIAAFKNERNSMGVEIDRSYCRMAAKRLKAESYGLFASSELIFEKAEMEARHQALYVDQELSRLQATRSRALLGHLQ